MGLSRRATQLPLTAISLGLEAWERSRGVRQFALRRGNEVLQIVAHTPLGRLLPTQVLDDGADEEAARLTADLRGGSPLRSVPSETDKPTSTGTTTKPRPATDGARPTESERPEVPEAAREVGAPGAVREEVEEITQQLDIPTPESRDELPIPDFDNISIGSLRSRMRGLDLEQLVVLREWEQAHAHRLPVLTALDNRIAKVTKDAGSSTGPSTGTATGSGKQTGGGQSTGAPDVGAPGTEYPSEATSAERAAEEQGGTLRV